MRVLVVHNAYLHRGGEDSVVEDEINLLRSRGHEVDCWLRHNDEINGISSAKLAFQTLWSNETLKEIAARARQFQPDVIHSHNTLPLVSPSLYWAAEWADVPVVQTLHNFRLMCLNGVFLRGLQVCEDCNGRSPWRGVVRKCYRNSGVASAAVAGMLALHRGIGTYRGKVARYIALNNFCREKFIEGGLPAERIVVKSNFVDSPPVEAVERHGLLFVGRLSAEKGIATLARATELSQNSPLRVVGEGPEMDLFAAKPSVVTVGRLPPQSVRREMQSAVALVVPSIWYENFPRTIVEAFAAGLPVIASRIGALAEVVGDGTTGLFFEPGNALGLAEKMAWALSNRNAMAEMGRAARARYEAEFSADVNYRKLVDIYQDAIREHRLSRDFERKRPAKSC